MHLKTLKKTAKLVYWNLILPSMDQIDILPLHVYLQVSFNVQYTSKSINSHWISLLQIINTLSTTTFNINKINVNVCQVKSGWCST